MIYPSQFEAAVHRFLASHPLRQTPICVHTWCNKFTEHIRLTFNMLRLMVMGGKCGDSLTKVKFPKTGGFRKSLGTSEWIVLKPLLAKIELQPVWANRVKAGNEPLVLESGIDDKKVICEETPRQQKTHDISPSTVELDEFGFPLIFQKRVRSMSLGSLGSTVGKETVSSSGTRYYPETLDSSSFQTPPAKHKPCLDASGFPVFNDIHCVTAKQSEQQGDEEQGAVVDGKSRRHKAATIEARKKKAAPKEAPKGATKAAPKEATKAAPKEATKPPKTSKPAEKKQRAETTSRPSTDDEILLRLKTTGPTMEVPPRVQICAASATTARIFICTLNPDKVTEWKTVVSAMSSKIEAGNCKKADLLKLRYILD